METKIDNSNLLWVWLLIKQKQHVKIPLFQFTNHARKQIMPAIFSQGLLQRTQTKNVSKY